MVPGIVMPAIVYGGVKLIEKVVETLAGGEEKKDAPPEAGSAATDAAAAGLWDSTQRTALGVGTVVIDAVGRGLEEIGEAALAVVRPPKEELNGWKPVLTLKPSDIAFLKWSRLQTRMEHYFHSLEECSERELAQMDGPEKECEKRFELDKALRIIFRAVDLRRAIQEVEYILKRAKNWEEEAPSPKASFLGAMQKMAMHGNDDPFFYLNSDEIDVIKGVSEHGKWLKEGAELLYMLIDIYVNKTNGESPIRAEDVRLMLETLRQADGM